MLYGLPTLCSMLKMERDTYTLLEADICSSICTQSFKTQTLGTHYFGITKEADVTVFSSVASHMAQFPRYNYYLDLKLPFELNVPYSLFPHQLK